MFKFFKNLPDEIVLKIFKNLSYSDLAKVSQVNHRFKLIAMDNSLELANYKDAYIFVNKIRLGDLDLIIKVKDKFHESDSLKGNHFDFIIDVYSKRNKHLDKCKRFLIFQTEATTKWKPNSIYYIRNNINQLFCMDTVVKSRREINLTQEDLKLFDSELKVSDLKDNVPRILSINEVDYISSLIDESRSYRIGNMKIIELKKNEIDKLIESAKEWEKNPLVISKFLRSYKSNRLAKLIENEYESIQNESKGKCLIS